MEVANRDSECEEKERALSFLDSEWPPPDPKTLYEWAYDRFGAIGKLTTLRAVLAVHAPLHADAQQTNYSRQAIAATERWVLDPSEENRKEAGRIASREEGEYEVRAIAHLAGSRNRWRSMSHLRFTGNPHYCTPEDFARRCEAIERELRLWASGQGDPVAERHTK